MKTHNPTPWEAGYATIIDANGEQVACTAMRNKLGDETDPAHANAEFIVEAVNYYAEVLKNTKP